MFNRQKTRSQDSIAIDLGAFHTRFYSATEGLLLDEPSIGALDMDHSVGGDTAVTSFGNTAASHIESKGDRLRVVHPVQSDSHNDLGLSQKMLAHFFTSARRSGLIRKNSKISLALPYNCDTKAASQMVQTCLNAGAAEASYQDATLAAFRGAQPHDTDTGVIIDFGATSSRMIAIANHEVIHYQTLACGGDDIDKILCAGLLEQFYFYVTEEAARDLKHHIGAATAQSVVQHSRKSYQLNCLSLKTNAKTQFRVGSETVSLILQPILSELMHSIRLAYASIDPEIKDITAKNGIQLCGGGTLLSRMDQLVMEATDLPVEVANRPFTCCVRGAASQLIDNSESLPQTESA